MREDMEAVRVMGGCGRQGKMERYDLLHSINI